jgi:Mlc titration factor MtfA (ptsG expression regulator)
MQSGPYYLTMEASSLIASSLVLVFAAMAMARWRHRRRLRRLRQCDLPTHWQAILARRVTGYARLPAPLKTELHGRVNEFLADKQFIGCRGQAIDDEVRLTIAGNACLLLLNRRIETYPDLRSILVYPDTFVVEFVEEHEGIEHEITDLRAGEDWENGPLILAWDEIQADRAAGDDRNVVIHEFAHRLDQANPAGEGFPDLQDAALAERWPTVMTREYEALTKALDAGEITLLDPYAAESPAEFFAVVTETFFTQPASLRTRLPELFDLLRDYYQVDPASW